MPPKECVRPEQRADLLELFAAESFTFDGQATTLIIGQSDPLPAELLFENGILGAKVLNDFLLLSIDPAGKDDQQQLLRLQNKFHRRLWDSENWRRSLVVNEMESCMTNPVTDRGWSPFR